MKAVRFYAPGDVRVEEIPVPDCNPGEIRVKVDACAVCGSDLKTFRVGNPRMKPPITMGHEFTGIIERMPERISGFEEGDRIVMATSISCGKCLYCKKGLTNLCINLAPMGFVYNGGMAEYVVIPQKAIANGHLIKVPKDIKAEYAALAEPLSCAVNSVSQSNIRKDDFVLIMGAGPMAILNALAAREFGASKIFMTELSEPRLEQARLFDIDRIINPANENLKEIIEEETDGCGADVVIVAAPAAAPQEESLELVRKQGTVCLFASLPKGKSSLNIDSRLIHYNEIRLTGSSDSTAEHVKRAVNMLSSPRFPAGKLVTHILGLNNIKDAFELMERGEALRVVLKP
ncbi:alcohol dehydrogenase catalytic domain-containing protein [Maribellus maritimus]|uniref:alcohol dehydrogenase catalytic domain-containing protein n=1 Tax=Maribellus maritimus TaxID=2870838 RepID=UPI001EEB8916|nr:alcohol dehydrogenase catalytic domain-containing protein [Maribellus maritimus]MCG6189525.1 alcohol dehydrogenase catalytic domain-containing protein [Maribellus maritimus]